MGTRSWLVSAPLLAAAFSIAAPAQNSTALDLAPKLLPPAFADWQSATSSQTPSSSLSLVDVSKAALEEDGPVRSQVADYAKSGRTLHVEAIEFGDRTGAYSAYTLVRPAGMHEGKELGVLGSVGGNAVLFLQGTVLTLAAPATEADIPALKALAEDFPKAAGNKNIPPILPTFAPERGLVNGGIRYAIGPASYAAQGGVLPANSIGWDKSAEAVTASYEDRRGKETLTLLIYPTPEIAIAHVHAITNAASSMGPNFTNARIHRDKELVALTSGTFSAADAQALADTVHMRQEVSIDKDVQPVFHVEMQKTASLLTNIALLFGVLAVAAVLLGLFLGGGRAMIRVMRGKSAAVEPEFLSLHLDTKSKAVRF